MTHKQQLIPLKISDSFFRLKPLVAAVRVVIAGGMFVGAVAPVLADLPVPIPGLGFDAAGSVPVPNLSVPVPVADVATIDSAPPVPDLPVPDSNFVSSGSADQPVTVGNTLQINHLSDKAILNWSKYNIGHDKTVQYDQPNTSSITLNRIFQDSPSVILGHINAKGEIYLVNSNGFVFGKDSVVDAHSLVASALNISDEAFKNGLIRQFDNNPNASIDAKAALNGNINSDGTAGTPVKSNVKITVAAGAKINAGKNGSIILAAPTVENSGSISAGQQGQILLVASKDKVYLQPTSKKDPFAGLLVEVGQGGKVINHAGGDIAVREGNVTLAGFAVNQSGRISATTSVNVNGSIRLLARENAQASVDTNNNSQYLTAAQTVRSSDLNDGLGTESKVVFGEDGSINSAQVLADVDGGSAIDEQEQKQSLVEVSAAKIDLKSGSSIVATSGLVNLTASNNTTDTPNNPLQGTVGRIDLESGSRIDVSGSKHVKVAMERNVADISVQSFNLRDAPYQRGGVLQGKTVQVDIRNLPKIIDASGGPQSIKKGIDERLGKGGTINLISAGDTLVNSGAVTDISGGSVDYQSGYINTTKLLTQNGRIVDITTVDPNEQLAAIFGSAKDFNSKWGVTTLVNFLGPLTNGQFENGYTEGKAGGALNIQSPSTSWDGQLVAGSVTGINQRNSPVSGGTLAINQGDNGGLTNAAGFFLSGQNVLFQTNAESLNLGLDAPNPNRDLVLSSAMVNQSGISNLTVKTAGNVTVAKDTTLSMPVLSKFNVEATHINVSGSIYSAGGTIALNSIFNSSNDSGQLNILAPALLDVSGRWINDFQMGLTSGINTPIVTNGGKVSLTAQNELNFNKGAMIKADGGAWLGLTGNRLTAGNAGDINLLAGTSTIVGSLHVDGGLSAYGLSQGGSLSLTTNKINIGAQVPEANALNLGVTQGVLDVAANAGFNKINLATNNQDITVKAGTDWSLISQNKVLIPTFRSHSSSNSIAGFSQVTTLPESNRQPVTLSLKGQTGVTLETGSKIHVDKASTVNLSTENASKGIYIDGLIDAPAGNINLNFTANLDTLTYDASQSIWLGSHAYLNTAGTTLFNLTDSLGRLSGSVLKGGDVSIQANRGYVVLENGSVINASGTSASLNIPTSNSGVASPQNASQVIGSDAGKIRIAAAEGIVLDGQLIAKAGSPTNLGGRLDLSLNRNFRKDQLNDPSYPENALQFNVVQDASGAMLPSNARFGSIPLGLNGHATVGSHQITQAGIDQLRLSVPLQIDNRNGNLRLPGVIEFNGDVNLNTASSLVLDAQTIGWSGLNGSSTGVVNLNSPYLQLGSSTYDTIIGTPVLGGGKLTTHANWTQLDGAALMSGFNEINLNSVHDLRTVGVVYPDSGRSYNGSFTTAANLNLSASQIYPTTLTHYAFNVTAPDGQLTITGRNTDVSPLSAAGELTLNAATINQNGVLKAPLGTIAMNAAKALSFGKDSVTSVSADGQTIPFGVIANNLWEYPIGDHNLVFNQSLLNPATNSQEYLTLGEKHLVFQSPDIQFKNGSVVDVSGGGDLLAYEFQPGLGGSFDYLLPGSPSYLGGFAILPSLGSSLAPYDPSLSGTLANDTKTTVYLNGTDKLAAGFYTILPARYALLPGAFLVTPQANTQDQIATNYTKTGLPIVAGYKTVAGTDVRDSRSSGYLIESSAEVQKHSQYNLQTANSFFAKQAAAKNISVPLLPNDSGQISIDASSRLLLDGQFKVAAPNGRGAKLDISSQNIEVVTSLSSTATPGTLEILDQNLSLLHVDSLLLGGTRQSNRLTGKTNLNVTADKVVFDPGVNLQTLDLIAAGKNKVEVMNGAAINSSGKVNTGESEFNLSGDSALLRVSADKQITVNRASYSGLTGDLLIDQGAILSASQSMVLDATRSTVLNGNINMNGGALSLNAQNINIGDVAGLTGNALNLTNQQLKGLSVDELLLNSRNSINFYGNVGQTDSNGNLAPIKFDKLIVDAAGFSGFGNTQLQANDLVLGNRYNAVSTITGSKQGTLDLLAGNYTQGAGNFGIKGFNTVNLTVDNGFIADGKSVLSIDGDMSLKAGYLTTTGGSSFTLDSSGHALQVTGNNSSYSPLTPAFGGAMSLVAHTIGFDAHALLSSGQLKLHAITGDVNVGSTANIDLAGRPVGFADTLDYTSGGTFTAVSDSGSVKLAAGSAVDISTGGGDAAGGILNLKAASSNQTVSLDGRITGKAASANLDVSTYCLTSSFDSLMNVLKNAGISNSIYFRTRDDNIVQSAGQVINANSLNLVSDKGKIDLAGTLNADGLKAGGVVNLYAGDKIILESGALVTAKGQDKGGKIMLSSDAPVQANPNGIELMSGSKIDVSGADAASGGTVILSALRTGDGINIKPIAGTVQGFSHFYAQGVRKYNNADLGNDGEINSQDINSINNDTANYMAVASQHVDGVLASGIRLRPDAEINYNGDLTVATPIDFSSQRFGLNSDMPGALTIRATGKLDVNNSITDGFDDQGKLQKGDSSTFQLAAGADLTSADKFATIPQTAAEKLANPTAKDLTIGSGASIHTGSGDIKLVSGGNFVVTDQTSTVYNLGRADLNNPYGAGLPGGLHVTGEYPIAGGDLVIRAGGDIKGAVSDQFFNPWLQSQGTNISTRANRNSLTAWAVNLNANQFQQNIGSFGGGKVDVSAEGNINDLSVMMPTTGKQLGNSFVSSNVQVQGGGVMRVSAGGNITGGAYYLGKGDGVITANGEISGSKSQALNAFSAGPQIVMSGDRSDPVNGNAKLSLNAGSGITIAGASDAMVLKKDNPEFFTYTDKSLLALKSLSGDVHLNSDTSVVNNILNISNFLEQRLSTVYPSSLDVTAFGGSVKLDQDIILFPSANANLNVLAKQDISSSTGQHSINMSDANPALLPNTYLTINSDNDQKLTNAASIFDTQSINVSGIPGGSTQVSLNPLIHAQSPIHSADKVPARLVTQVGDISSVQIILPKQSIIQAGNDLKNSPVQVQQINQSDRSIISAGRDIIFEADRDNNGAPTSKNNLYQISVSGPGRTLVKTGRDLDLGASVGLTTVGNLYNASLPSHGASLDVLVGLNGGKPDYTAFIEKYLQTNSLYAEQLSQVTTLITGFMRQYTGDATLIDAKALKDFGDLTSDKSLPIQPQLNAILTGVFFNELKIAGTASASDKLVGNKGGFEAIATLFPENQWHGDLSLFFSKLQTVSGGDINLMVPGGQVNAGLAVAPSGSAGKSADKLGIVAQAQGHIYAFVKNDFTVNTSRVFTLGGGDILIWSSDGNIDAGKGAKSALAVSVDTPYYDSNNQLVIPAPKITSGSGIRTAASSGVTAGDVYLFAPQGVVDAGEAGIGGNNITISATAVLGANNIQIGGVSSGVPTAPTGSIAAGLTGTSNATASVSQGAQDLAGLDNNNSKSNTNVALGIMTSELLSYGGSSDQGQPKNKPVDYEDNKDQSKQKKKGAGNAKG